MVEKVPKFQEDHRMEFFMLHNSLPDDIQEQFISYMGSPGRSYPGFSGLIYLLRKHSGYAIL